MSLFPSAYPPGFVQHMVLGTKVVVPESCHKLGLSLKSLRLSQPQLATQHPFSPSPQIQAGWKSQGQWSLEGCPIPPYQKLREAPLRCDDFTFSPRVPGTSNWNRKSNLGMSGVLALTPPSPPLTHRGRQEGDSLFLLIFWSGK